MVVCSWGLFNWRKPSPLSTTKHSNVLIMLMIKRINERAVHWFQLVVDKFSVQLITALSLDYSRSSSRVPCTACNWPLFNASRRLKQFVIVFMRRGFNAPRGLWRASCLTCPSLWCSLHPNTGFRLDHCLYHGIYMDLAL